MNFRIIGDLIEYGYRPFARIVAPEFSTMRELAEGELWTCDASAREKEIEEVREETDREYRGIKEALEDRISELERQVADLETLLDAAADGDFLARYTNACKDAAYWRNVALAQADKIRELQAVKPRRPRNRSV